MKIIEQRALKKEHSLWGYVYQVEEEAEVEKDMKEYAEHLLARAVAKRKQECKNASCLQFLIADKGVVCM